MIRKFFKCLLPLVLLCCKERPKHEEHSIYTSVTSDSALFYYHLGWQQIMDEGNYGLAEVSYRKVLEHDSNFLIGKSVLGRLTLDLEERLRIFEEVEKRKNEIKGDERLILDAYHALVEFTNAREQKSLNMTSLRNTVFELAENNLRSIVHKYPEEVYMKAEYIEFLHAKYGASMAMDSMATLISASQKDNPFLLGYAASMNAELQNYNLALAQAKRLEEVIRNTSVPKPFAVFADIYLQMDSLVPAKINADKANALDPRNLDASRLKQQIDSFFDR